MSRTIYSFLAALAAITFFLVACDDESWTKYELRKPEFIQCKDAADAQHLAYLYMTQIDGIEVQHVPASFSMSRTFQTGDIYVIEAVSFDQAGGYPMIYWRDGTHRERILHWALAKNAKGEYITAGDSPRNQLDDETLGIAHPVGPDRYYGVVKKAFTYPR